MFPLKRFIQGPSLHEESFSRNDVVSKSVGSLNGEEARKAYEEIINLPSTSATVSVSKPKIVANSKKSDKTGGERTTETRVAPKRSRLFYFCESNDHRALQDTFEHFKNEIDIDSTDEYGWTLLMSASCAGSLECVSILLQNGANWTLEDKKGRTALCLAKQSRKDTVCGFLNEWQQCYMEHRYRDYQQQQDRAGAHSLQSQSSLEEEGNSASKYCEACKINYESSTKETHERSIAHLVSTAEFGKDKIHFGIPESNKGFQLMVKSGWDKNSGLGPEGTGHKFPVKTILKRNKLGLGNEKEVKSARITHFGPFDPAAVETQPERIEREVTVRRREALKRKCKDKKKEIEFRREFSSL